MELNKLWKAQLTDSEKSSRQSPCGKQHHRYSAATNQLHRVSLTLPHPVWTHFVTANTNQWRQPTPLIPVINRIPWHWYHIHEKKKICRPRWVFGICWLVVAMETLPFSVSHAKTIQERLTLEGIIIILNSVISIFAFSPPVSVVRSENVLWQQLPRY